MKYIFKQIDEYTPSETTVEFTTDTINGIFEQFQFFLKGCGYVFNGQIDIVPDEEYYGDGHDGMGSTLEDYPELMETKSSYYFDTERNK